MKVKINEYKMLSNYISSVSQSLEIWTQVYEITNPITDFRVKNEKRLVKLYGWLAVLNIVFLMICAYNRFTFIFNNDILLIVLVLFFYAWFRLCDYNIYRNRLWICFALLHNHRL